VIWSGTAGAQWNVFHAILLDCHSSTLFLTAFAGDHPNVGYNHICNNTADESLVIASGWGPHFDHCVFLNNVCPAYFAGGAGQWPATAGYFLIDCVFDASFPTGDIIFTFVNSDFNWFSAPLSSVAAPVCYVGTSQYFTEWRSVRKARSCFIRMHIFTFFLSG
jgi:hypothetical protein